VQSEEVPTESQVFEDEVLAGAKRADDPPGEMPERHNHGKNTIGTIEFSFALSHSFCRCTTFWRDTGMSFGERRKFKLPFRDQNERLAQLQPARWSMIEPCRRSIPNYLA